MKLTFEETSNEYYIETLLNDPDLYKLCFGVPLRKDGKNRAEMERGFQYVYAKHGNTVVGLINYRQLGHNAIEAHLKVLTKRDRAKVGMQIIQQFYPIVKKTEIIKNVVTSAPANCRHANIFALKAGFKPCGMIPNSVTYRGVLTHLNMYYMEIK